MYSKEFIQDKIRTDERWLFRTLEVIYNRQTKEEQNSQSTMEHNNRGFTGIDGKLLSSFQEQVMKNKQLNRPTLLSPKQIELCKKKLPKYWKQIKQEIESKEQVGK